MTDHKETAEKIVRNIPVERMDLHGRLELRDEIIAALSVAERNAKPVVPDGHIYQCRGVKNDVPCSYLTTSPICTRCGTPSPFCTKTEVRNSTLEEAAKECERIFRIAHVPGVTGHKEISRQNQISHGCVASAEAIRSLKAKP